MTDYSAIIKLLSESKSIGIFMHINPDGDCISSALALYLFLKKKGKEVAVFSQNCDSSVLPDKFNFLPGIKDINAVPLNDNCDLSVGVDIADVGRLGEICFRMFMHSKNNLIIDHHMAEKEFSRNVIRESDSSSTAQIIYKILKEYDATLIDAEIATCLYTGIITDSGCFSFPSTSPETHIIAAELLQYEINASEIVRTVMKDTEIKTFKLKNTVLSRTEFFDNNTIGLISFFANDYEKTGTSEKSTEGIINSVIDIIGVEIAISISEINYRSYKVSFRTKHNVDAAACARCFGGGGHFHAAGCRLYGYYEDVKNKILGAVREIAAYA